MLFRSLKDRYDSKRTKDLVKATAKLEKWYMKLDLDDPHPWILELERLNRTREPKYEVTIEIFTHFSKKFSGVSSYKFVAYIYKISTEVFALQIF